MTSAQNITVQVNFDRHRKLPKSIEESDDLALKQEVLRQYKEADRFTLYFNGVDYLFSQAELSPNGSPFALEGDNAVYINRSTKQRVSIKSVIDKSFAVEDSIPQSPWSIHFESVKMVLGKLCRKVTLPIEKGEEAVAWFCDELPIPVGPAGYIIGISASSPVQGF